MKTLSLKSIAVVAFIMLAVVSCSKKNDVAPADPIVGKWVGTYKQANNENSFYFAFNIKPNGKLEVKHDAYSVIAEGTWKVEDGLFTAEYIYTGSDDVYSAAAKYDAVEGTLAGSFGEGDDNTAAADFLLTKQ